MPGVLLTTIASPDRAAAEHHLSRYLLTCQVLPLDPGPLTSRIGLATDGTVVLGDISFGADVTITCGEPGGYEIGIPLGGTLAWRQAGSDPRLAGPGTAVLFDQAGPVTIDRWTGDCRTHGLRVETDALRRVLAEQTGRPVPGAVRLGPTIDVRSGHGASWARLLHLTVTGAGSGTGLFEHPVVGSLVTEALTTGLLLTARHQYHDLLNRRVPDTAPRSLRAVVDAVRASPTSPFTVAGLAAIAGVGSRTLQQAFRRHLDTTPAEFLRQERLAAAHRDLQTTDPGSVTVAEVAYRNGFPHHGRFAAAYLRRYGVSPARTLRT
jgi:AraC-like DNA-binding protein